MQTGTILVIEDEKKISDIVSLYLEKSGFSVKVAGTGKLALSLLREPFALIILDLRLPDIPGEDICSAIRETSEVPVIMLTAKSGEKERIRGLGLGADDYVVKPFSPGELVARVKALLRRARKISQKILSFNKGLLRINSENLEVVKGSTSVVLTPTEFRILMTLADKPGRVFTRLHLIDTVRGYDFEGYDRTIDAHMKNLRRKIEADHRNPVLLKTVYGIGYKFSGTPDED